MLVRITARARIAACALALLSLAACATGPKLPPEIAARPELAEAAEEPSVFDVYDPLEGLNRAIYNFNAGFDRYIFLPIVRAYEFVTPTFVQHRVSDFFDNVRELPNFANALLQLKGETAGRAAVRFVVNTMFTGGLFDLAGAQGHRADQRGFRPDAGLLGSRRGAVSGAAGAGPVQSARHHRNRRRRAVLLAADA